MMKKYYTAYFFSMLFFSIFLALVSCNIDYSKLFSDDSISPDRGYTADELLLFYNLAKLAAIDYNGMDDEALDNLGNEIKYDVKTNTTEYSSKYGVEEVKGSAAFVYPTADAPSGGWPLLISMHHTLLRDVEAPSFVTEKAPSFSFGNIAQFEPSLHPILLASGMGFVVYAPDMLGFGSSKKRVHPFMNKAYLMSDIFLGLESVIKTLEQDGIMINKQKIFITGYSHGAWVATQFYEYLNTNHPNYNVIAGVSSAGIYYIRGLVDDLLARETSSLPLFFPYMIYGYLGSNTLTGVSYADFFKPPYNALDFEGDLFNGEHNNKYVDEKLTSKIADLYNAAFIANHSTGIYADFWTQALTDSVNPWKASGTLLIIHHIDDEVSPLAQVNGFITDMKAVAGQNNANIQSNIGTWGEGSSHEATALKTYIDGLYWLVKQK